MFTLVTEGGVEHLHILQPINRCYFLRLYGHVARFLAEDSAHRILFCRDPSGWAMPRGRPHASRLRQVEAYLKDMGMTGLAFAWAMARRRSI